MKFRLLLSLVIIVTTLGLGLGFPPASSRAAAQPQSPEATPLPPGAAPDRRADGTDGLVQAVQEAIATREDVLAFVLSEVSIDHIDFAPDGSQALVYLAAIDPQTGQVIAREPGLAIASLTASGMAKLSAGELAAGPSSDWQLTFQADPGWTGQLASLPPDLLTDDLRQRFLSPEIQPESTEGLVLGGYYLPWAGGQTKNLTWSVSHGSCSGGACLYAFDFADGTMFPLLAAKGGVVFDAVDKWQNGNSTRTNWLILQDASTTPVSYQVYYHLAQNSIPPQLRVKGAPVRQGQYIGNADDTGASTGHHLHFMVHTSTYGFWGNSVDITFRDVSINYDAATQGGRPRLPKEASTYGGQGQEKYTSGNHGSILPVGGLTGPADGITVTGTVVHVQGAASDDLGITRLQVVANYGGGWVEVGPSQPRSPAQTPAGLSMDLDLCAAGVPDGPVSLGVKFWDVEGNEVFSAQAPHNLLKQYACPGAPPQPPLLCQPTAYQVALYTAPNFGGTCQLYNAGDYPDGPSMGSTGERGAASVQVGDKVSATLFSQVGLKGRAESFSAQDRNLADNLIGAYTAASLRVQMRTTIPAAPALNAPGSLTADDSVLLSWSNTGGATEFDPQVCKVGDPSFCPERGFKPVQSWPLGSLTASSYTWKVTGRVLNSAGEPITGTVGEGSFSVAPAPAVTAAPAAFPYEAAFEGGAAGWTAVGDWSIQAVTGAQGQPTQAYVYNAAGGCADGVRCSGSLTSPPVLLPASGAAYLRFGYRYSGETANSYWDRRWVMYSSSTAPGGPYLPWRNLTSELSGDPGGWLPSPDGLDLLRIPDPSIAGKYVRIRFFYDSADALQNSGTSWTIDDVKIDAAPLVSAGDLNEPNNQSAQATWITVGGTKTGTISPGGDVDYFRFSAAKGQVLLAEVSNQGSSFDPSLALLDTDGAALIAQSAGPGGSGTARASFVVPLNGVYYLRVRPGNFPAGSADIPYTISLVQPGDATRPAIQMISPVSGQAAPPWPLALSVQGNDGGGTGISRVDFFYHLSDWVNGRWIWIGSDWNGADGWGIPFYPGTQPVIQGFGVWARAYDWAFNTADAVSYQAFAGTGVSIYMPVVSQ